MFAVSLSASLVERTTAVIYPGVPGLMLTSSLVASILIAPAKGATVYLLWKAVVTAL